MQRTSCQPVLRLLASGLLAVTPAAGKSVQLASARACGWLPLTASTEDGTVIDQYAQRCDGGTWTLR